MSDQTQLYHSRRLPSINALLEGVSLPPRSFRLQDPHSLGSSDCINPGNIFPAVPVLSLPGLNAAFCHDSPVSSPDETKEHWTPELNTECPGICDSASYNARYAQLIPTEVVENDETAHRMAFDVSDAKTNSFSTADHSMSSENKIPSSPVQKGWFDPSTEYCKKICERVHGWDRDRLYEQYFFRDPDRATYGEKPVKRPTKSKSEVTDHINVITPSQVGRIKHSEVEKGRRDRHRDRQRESHARCCDMAVFLSEQNMDQYKQTKFQSSRGPGKDDQLLSTLYMFDYGALTLQSEHEGRKLAESQCNRLLAEIEDLNKETEKKNKLIEELSEQSRQRADLCVGNSKQIPDHGVKSSIPVLQNIDASHMALQTATSLLTYQSKGDYVSDVITEVDNLYHHPQSNPRKRPRRTGRCETAHRTKHYHTRGLPPSPSPSSDGNSV